jgi:hypothetical protein
LEEEEEEEEEEGGNVTEHKMWVLIFCTNLSETILILRRNERDIIKNVHWSS